MNLGRRLAVIFVMAQFAVPAALATPQHIPWPAWWHSQAMCFHRAEAVNWYEKRNPGSRGGFQFEYSTWSTTMQRHHLHFASDPANATIYQQTLVAWYRWLDAGRAWSDWLPYDHAYYCLRA